MKKINRHGIIAAKMSCYNYNENLGYFCIEALEDGLQANLSVNTCEYSLDGNTWNSLSAATNTPTVNTGEKIYFRGNLTPKSSSGIGTFTISKKCNLKGNIMSLLYGDNFEGQNDLTGKNYAFYRLFYNCKTIIDVSELILPATTLVTNCYCYMFYGCTGLTSTPQLPATTLASDCYRSMFYGCTGLTSAPELPATKLATQCYYDMFYGCTSLTTAPELPATTLATRCYYYMFGNCTGLTTSPDLPATTLANNCYYNMFRGCTGLTTAPELPATTLASYCYYFMFYGCTSLTTAPELPATTLALNCYYSMFYGTNVLPDCSNIDFSNTSVVKSGGLKGLFAGTKVTDTDLNHILPKNSNGKYCLPATTLAEYCYQNMFGGCTSLVTAPELPATTLVDDCYYDMFYGCTSLVTAPELPATTLAERCYNSMFYGCSNLNYIKMLATDISASNCLNNWVYGVSRSGTFVKHPNMTSLPSGDSGIPDGWTVEDYLDGGNLIKFYIDDSVDIYEFSCEAGMTWLDFIESKYNPTQGVISGFKIHTSGNSYVIADHESIGEGCWISEDYNGGHSCSVDSYIVNGFTYYIR